MDVCVGVTVGVFVTFGVGVGVAKIVSKTTKISIGLIKTFW